MIKELVQFMEALDEELKNIGIVPKEGIHVFLNFEIDENNKVSISEKFRYEVYSKKQKDLSLLMRTAAALGQAAWMVNTNKCFDLPAKGIHSCSPYCLAFKRESIRGGGKYDEAKTKLYQRVENYFKNTLELLAESSEIEQARVFQNVLGVNKKCIFI